TLERCLLRRRAGCRQFRRPVTADRIRLDLFAEVVGKNATGRVHDLHEDRLKQLSGAKQIAALEGGGDVERDGQIVLIEPRLADLARDYVVLLGLRLEVGNLLLKL